MSSYLDLAKKVEARLQQVTPRVPEEPVCNPVTGSTAARDYEESSTQPTVSRLAGASTAGRVGEALPFLGMSLDEFQAKGALLEVRAPGLEWTLWFVPGETDAKHLMVQGVGRGRIWTAVELKDLMAIERRTLEQVRTLARAKIEFDGTVVEVRQRG